MGRAQQRATAPNLTRRSPRRNRDVPDTRQPTTRRRSAPWQCETVPIRKLAPLPRSVARDRGVRVDDVRHVDHAHAVGAVGAVKDERPPARARAARSASAYSRSGGRERPAARSARVRARRRLDAVDRAHPLGEADVVRAVLAGALPGHVGRGEERLRPHGAVGPALPRARREPVGHEMRHERRGHDRVVARLAGSPTAAVR